MNEAIRLNFWPKARIVYPTNFRGQLYVPSANWFLAGCIGIVLYFRESSSMEAAYGPGNYHYNDKYHIAAGILSLHIRTSLWLIGGLLVLFLSVEISSIANLDKFPHGGWLTLLIASVWLHWCGHGSKQGKSETDLLTFVNWKTTWISFVILAMIFQFKIFHASCISHERKHGGGNWSEGGVFYSSKTTETGWRILVCSRRCNRRTLYYWLQSNGVDKGNIFRVDFRLGFRGNHASTGCSGWL